MKEKAPEKKAPVEKREKRERWRMAARSLASESHPSRDEDSYIADEEEGLVGVFDGTGGHAAGQEASRAAVAAVKEEMGEWEELAEDEIDEITPPSLANVLRTAEKRVVSRGNEVYLATPEKDRGPWRSPQTTATIAKLHEFSDGRMAAYIAWVGDSRAYVRRADGTLEQLTHDDDLLAGSDGPALIEVMFQVRLSEADIARYRTLMDEAESEDAMPDAVGKYLFRMRNVLGEALGVENRARPLAVHIATTTLKAGDILLITSDGVHGNLTPGRLRDIGASATGPDDFVERLVTEAYEYAHTAQLRQSEGPTVRSHRDDITAVAVQA